MESLGSVVLYNIWEYLNDDNGVSRLLLANASSNLRAILLPLRFQTITIRSLTSAQDFLQFSERQFDKYVRKLIWIDEEFEEVAKTEETAIVFSEIVNRMSVNLVKLSVSGSYLVNFFANIQSFNLRNMEIELNCSSKFEGTLNFPIEYIHHLRIRGNYCKTLSGFQSNIKHIHTLEINLIDLLYHQYYFKLDDNEGFFETTRIDKFKVGIDRLTDAFQSKSTFHALKLFEMLESKGTKTTLSITTDKIAEIILLFFSEQLKFNGCLKRIFNDSITKFKGFKLDGSKFVIYIKKNGFCDSTIEQIAEFVAFFNIFEISFTGNRFELMPDSGTFPPSDYEVNTTEFLNSLIEHKSFLLGIEKITFNLGLFYDGVAVVSRFIRKLPNLKILNIVYGRLISFDSQWDDYETKEKRLQIAKDRSTIFFDDYNGGEYKNKSLNDRVGYMFEDLIYSGHWDEESEEKRKNEPPLNFHNDAISNKWLYQILNASNKCQFLRKIKITNIRNNSERCIKISEIVKKSKKKWTCQQVKHEFTLEVQNP